MKAVHKDWQLKMFQGYQFPIINNINLLQLQC